MRKFVIIVIFILTLMLDSCACTCTDRDREASSPGQAGPQEATYTDDTDAGSSADLQKENESMTAYDFSVFPNVELSGVDLKKLSKEQLSVLYTQAQYCQAMTDADLDTMRQIVSEDMTFTHMSGMKQTREEYFADIEDGSLDYHRIGIENPVIQVDGNRAAVTFTSILNANAYGARGTYRMHGSHRYEFRDGTWVAVNR